MTTTTSTRQVALDHPYWGVGVALIIIAFVVLAFSLGVLSRCPGSGHGVCLDLKTTNHVLGAAGLILFVILLIVGIVLLVYTGARTFTAQTTTATAPAPAPTVIVPPASAAPTTPPPTTVNVNPPPRYPPP